MLWQAQNRDGVEIALTDQYYGTVPDASIRTFRQNSIPGNAGGWAACELNRVTCPEYEAALPEALRNAIRTVQIWSDNGGSSDRTVNAITHTAARIYLPEQREFWGSANDWCANPGMNAFASQWEWIRLGNWLFAYRSDKPSEKSPLLMRTPTLIDGVAWNKRGAENQLQYWSGNMSLGFKPAFQI